MNTVDVLKYGNVTFVGTLELVPETVRGTSGACGWWSVKDLVAHLASYEQMLVEVLAGFIGERPTPYLDSMMNPELDFNVYWVEQRRNHSYEAVLEEYNGCHSEVMRLIQQIPAETARQPGMLPWYGMEYALDDYIVYAFYGHKREHSGQIAVFCDAVRA